MRSLKTRRRSKDDGDESEMELLRRKLIEAESREAKLKERVSQLESELSELKMMNIAKENFSKLTAEEGDNVAAAGNSNGASTHPKNPGERDAPDSVALTASQIEIRKRQSGYRTQLLSSFHTANRSARRNVFAEPVDASQDLDIPTYEKTEAEIRFLDGIISENFIFSSLTGEHRRSLIDAMKMETLPAKTVIVKKQEVGEYFYVVEEGDVCFVVDDENVAFLSRGASFGELALLRQRSRTTCVVNTDCRLWKVGQLTFRYMVAKSNSRHHPPSNNNDNDDDDNALKYPSYSSLPSLDRSQIHLEDLERKRILVVGEAGNVELVSHRRTGVPYALKTLDKRTIINNRRAEGIVRENNIWKAVQHPFLVRLIASFQDEWQLYMLTSFLRGGDLFSLIHYYDAAACPTSQLHTGERDGLPDDSSRFYAACVFEALAHLHNHRVVHRNVKPENILMDSQGYCVLVDFGNAKLVAKGEKTYTLCGTPEYLAPEIILSKGHDKGADYWALGVLIYEMLLGRSPFSDLEDRGGALSQVNLFKRIVNVKYAFPPGGVVVDAALDLIKRLVCSNTNVRFGCLTRGDADVREHHWFEPIDCERLLARELPAPWVPEAEDALDARHFKSHQTHPTEHKPDLMTSKRPLSAMQQDLFRDFEERLLV